MQTHKRFSDSCVVGLVFKPPIFLKPGDVMELSVEGLGVQRQEIVADD